MRFLTMLILFTCLFIIAPVVSFGCKTPLSQFSSQWDSEYFDKANTTVSEYYLSDNEKEFIFIINLARINPLLFKETVLIPYCDKNGYSGPAYELIGKMSSVCRLSMLSAHIYFKKQAKCYLDEKRIVEYNGVDSPDGLLQGKIPSRPLVYFFSKTNRAIDIILQLLMDNGNNGKLFREMFFGDYSDAGVFIKNHPYKGFVTALLFDKITPEQRNKLPQYPDLNTQTFEESMMIKLDEYPNDSILNYFVKKFQSENSILDNGEKQPIFLTSQSVFKSREDIQRITDSLMQFNVSHSTREISYTVNLERRNNLRTKNKRLGKNEYNYYKSAMSKGTILLDDAEKQVNVYYAGRTYDPQNRETIVTISCLRTKETEPQFPADSIGDFDPNISLSQVDAYVNSLGNCDTSKLAIILIKPWKKELEKVRAIFKWLNNNIHYDYVGLENGKYTYEVADVLKYRVAVCAGYSMLFQYLCSKAGIRCSTIYGSTPSGEHAWNAVSIDKKWYLIDATWGYHYFLMKPEDFIKEHFPRVRKWTLMTNVLTNREWKEKYCGENN
jgi:Transglutaminase-like superfamily